MTNKTYSTHVLEQIKGDFTGDIEQYLIGDLEGYSDDWYTHLQDIINFGCQGGTVSGLTYYNDTIKFHDDFEDEIDEIIEEFMENTGMIFSQIHSDFNQPDIDLIKNRKAWLAYEETAQKINNALENGEYEDLEEGVASFLDDMIMVSGFEYDEHKQIAISIFESVEEIDSEIDLDDDRITQDVNLHSLVETLLYNGFSMEDIEQQMNHGNISFSFNTESGMYVMSIQ